MIRARLESCLKVLKRPSSGAMIPRGGIRGWVGTLEGFIKGLWPLQLEGLKLQLITWAFEVPNINGTGVSNCVQ